MKCPELHNTCSLLVIRAGMVYRKVRPNFTLNLYQKSKSQPTWMSMLPNRYTVDSLWIQTLDVDLFDCPKRVQLLPSRTEEQFWPWADVCKATCKHLPHRWRWCYSGAQFNVLKFFTFCWNSCEETRPKASEFIATVLEHTLYFVLRLCWKVPLCGCFKYFLNVFGFTPVRYLYGGVG